MSSLEGGSVKFHTYYDLIDFSQPIKMLLLVTQRPTNCLALTFEVDVTYSPVFNLYATSASYLLDASNDQRPNEDITHHIDIDVRSR